MKNLTKFKSTYDSKDTFQLFTNKTGKPVVIFNAFCKDYPFIDLSYETKKRYSTVISNFIDFIYEYNNCTTNLNYIELMVILKSYPQFYAKGCDIHVGNLYSEEWEYERHISNKLIIAAKKLNIKPHHKNSIVNFKAAMNMFLKYCAETFEHSMLWIKNIKNETIYDIENFNKEVIRSTTLSNYEKEKLHAASWFGATYHKTKKGITLKSSIYKIDKTNEVEIVKYFPFEHLYALFNSASNLRDKLIWMLMFGTGLRESEAIRIKLTDIDFTNYKVYVRDDNNSRFSCDRHKRFKGRNYSDTVFIPFIKKDFFNILFDYMKHEYVRNLNHPFIFTIKAGKNKGNPYFETSDHVRIQAFKRAVKRAKIDTNQRDILNNINKDPKPHSLRHSYGMFMKNFIKTKEGYGLEIDEVQQLMGHANINSTIKYAIAEKIKTLNKISYAFNNRNINLDINDNFITKTIKDYIIDELVK